MSAAALSAALLAILGSVAPAQQDRFTLRIPDGLTFAEFKGYESWETVTITVDSTSPAGPIAKPTALQPVELVPV